MDLQKKQLDDLNVWLNKMEESIAVEAEVGASLEDVKSQIENHKVIITNRPQFIHLLKTVAKEYLVSYKHLIMYLLPRTEYVIVRNIP